MEGCTRFTRFQQSKPDEKVGPLKTAIEIELEKLVGWGYTYVCELTPGDWTVSHVGGFYRIQPDVTHAIHKITPYLIVELKSGISGIPASIYNSIHQLALDGKEVYILVKRPMEIVFVEYTLYHISQVVDGMQGYLTFTVNRSEEVQTSPVQIVIHDQIKEG